MKFKEVVVFLVVAVFGGPFDVFGGNKDFFPSTDEYKEEIHVFDYSSVSQGVRLAAVSLQGLVNRDTAQIFLKDNLSTELFQLYFEKNLVKTQQVYDNIYDLLKRFDEYYSGAVVYDPENSFTINLATNIAGVENRIIISPEMIEDFKDYTGISNVLDLRNNNFSSRKEGFIWYKENFFPFQTDSVLSVAGDGYMHDVYRDYLIEFRIPTFWLPGHDDSDYDAEYENLIKGMFENTPENIPVLGFWPDDQENGYAEFEGVKFAGLYGKFTVVNTWVGNYSFHSAFESDYNFEQSKARSKEFREYDPSKKYVALIMIESGDSPAYMQYGFLDRQWNDPYRGKVPISYGINPSMRMLLPTLTEHLFETATENDFFFNSISGAGYCYPFENYAQKTSNSDKTLSEYFKLTADNMALLDLDMLGLYTHSSTTDGKWTTDDERIFINFIEPMEGLRSLISGMHRMGYSGSNANKVYNNYSKDVTVHHNLTFWPSMDYTWNDESQDAEAVAFMEKEIKTYGAGGNFIPAMFYSWMYGPRRLKQLQDKMSEEGYVFVTLNEFDHLYRESKDLSNLRDVSTEKCDFRVYPNPVGDTLQFSNKINGTIGIYDIKGQIIKQVKGQRVKDISLDQLQNGAYIIKVTKDNDEQNSFMIVKR